jgi:hypothetical protein
MRPEEQWNSIEQGLDPRWSDALLELRVDDETQRRRAAALLGPASPGFRGSAIRFHVTRTGAGVGPEAVRRMLRKIDSESIRGTLVLVSSEEAQPEQATSRPPLADEWDASLAMLPSDWSDLLCELDLMSSDHIEIGALLLAPLNPIQSTERLGFHFRCASSFGYGASPGMVRRCLARLDHGGIPGDVRILFVQSDTHPVGTQGPVWYVGGQAV